MVLAGLGLNPAGVSLFRMHAPQSPLTRNWLPLEAWILAFFGPWSWWLHHLLFVVALHHLSVSLGRQNATLGTFTGDGFGRFGLESCWGFPSERNVREFYGGWFWQVWAWILLEFPCFACVPHRALWRGIAFRLRLESSRSSGLDLGGCIIFCLWLHCIIFLFL